MGRTMAPILFGDNLWRNFEIVLSDRIKEAGSPPVFGMLNSYAGLIAPLLITTHASMYTVVMGIQPMTVVADACPLWHLVTATAIVAILPPVLAMQRLFAKGLVEAEK